MKVKCPVCGKSWADEGGGGRITYYQCPNCGAVFSVQRSLQIELAVFS